MIAILLYLTQLFSLVSNVSFLELIKDLFLQENISETVVYSCNQHMNYQYTKFPVQKGSGEAINYKPQPVFRDVKM